MKRTLTFLLLAGIALLSHETRADVDLFVAGETAPRRIHGDLTLSPSTFHRDGTGINRGLLTTQITDFLDDHSSSFGIAAAGDDLHRRRTTVDADGISARFVQSHDRVPVEGAELVAIFDAGGRLTALNSSLVPTPSITVQPEIDTAAARAAAARTLGYADPVVQDERLVIVLDGTGTPAQKTPLLVRELSIWERDGSKPLRVQVLAQGAAKGTVHAEIPHAKTILPEVRIFDASVTLLIPNPIFRGVEVLRNGRKTRAISVAERLSGRSLVSGEATGAHGTITRTMEFYSRAFGRNGYDGQGALVNASVNVNRLALFDLLGQRENAAWVAPFKMFAFGAGGSDMRGFASALDVVGHEYTHAVIDASSELEYAGQSGALNESLADVLGEMIQADAGPTDRPFLLGETLLTDEARTRTGKQALRDMMSPHDGLVWQPAHLSEIPEKFRPGCRPAGNNDSCGVHILSGIPNRAAALVAREVGWESARKLFYRVMTARLRSQSDFTDYRSQLEAEALELEGGSAGTLTRAVRDACGAVGL